METQIIEKYVLAYSGGLDIVLTTTKNEVQDRTVTVDVGQG